MIENLTLDVCYGKEKISERISIKLFEFFNLKHDIFCEIDFSFTNRNIESSKILYNQINYYTKKILAFFRLKITMIAQTEENDIKYICNHEIKQIDPLTFRLGFTINYSQQKTLYDLDFFYHEILKKKQEEAERKRILEYERMRQASAEQERQRQEELEKERQRQERLRKQREGRIKKKLEEENRKKAEEEQKILLTKKLARKIPVKIVNV